MRAVVLKGVREVAVEEVPDPDIEVPTDAIVRITSAAICGSDLHMYAGRTSAAPGLVLGHEPLGVVDMRMPVMSGAEFAAEYLARYIEKEQRAPIVVMTAAEHVSKRCREIGANDFLAKPFSVDELVAVVIKHLPKEGSRSGRAAGV